MDKIMIDKLEVKRLDKMFSCKLEMLGYNNQINITSVSQFKREHWILDVYDDGISILHQSKGYKGGIHYHEQRVVKTLFQAYDSIHNHLPSKGDRRMHYLNKMFAKLEVYN